MATTYLTTGTFTTSTTTGGLVTMPSLTTTTASFASVGTVATNTTQAFDGVWQAWVDGDRYHGDRYYYNQPVWEAWVTDDEQRAARDAEVRRQRDVLQARREQQSRERLAREQERVENRLVAHARALELLDDLLTPEERALRVAEQQVAVRGSDGHLYRIEMHNESVHGNIVRTDEHGCRLGRACVAPRMYDERDVLPTPDGWIGQYLGLKFDAEQFLSHANWSGRLNCQVPPEQDVAA